MRGDGVVGRPQADLAAGEDAHRRPVAIAHSELAKERSSRHQDEDSATKTAAVSQAVGNVRVLVAVACGGFDHCGRRGRRRVLLTKVVALSHQC